MNFILIMSGGAGDRVGAYIPKQYHVVAGKPVIDYVIDACVSSEKADKIAIVMDKNWINYSDKIKNSDFLIIPNGQTRIQSLHNALVEIKRDYTCDKIVIVDAVAPFIYSKIIDDYFDWLDEYDAVITAQHITGALTNTHDENLNREDYIITQSPEAFRFDIFYKNFDPKFPYQEMAGMLPPGSKRKYYYGFKNNLKLTYDYELGYAEYMLSKIGATRNANNIAFFNRGILVTEGLRSFLLRNDKERTEKWLDDIYRAFPRLIQKWSLTSFIPNQSSLYGLVLQATSSKFGDVVIKFIPEFVGRYERELEAMQHLPSSYMCRLYDWDLESRCMLLSKVENAHFASFDENLKLTDFFHKVIGDAVPYSDDLELKYIPDYYDELIRKLNAMDIVPYQKEPVERELKYAIGLYERYFADAPKYVLHGDLHYLNVLDDGVAFYGIDPNGFIAPIELECVRFIRNDVRDHASFGYKERYELLLNSFARFVDRERLNLMFIIDMAMCTYNSVFENETDAETLVDLELIRIAREHYEETMKKEKVTA